MKTHNLPITVYDEHDTTGFIDVSKSKSLSDLGFRLPKESPTKVISIRLPTNLYNQIKAYATNIDMPYQAFIKYVLSKEVGKKRASQPVPLA